MRSNSLLSFACAAALLPLAPLLGAPAAPALPAGAPAYLQIVNATSVEKISLASDGTEIYPELPQGQSSACGPWAQPSPRFAAVNLDGGRKKESDPLKLAPNSAQTLVIMGDFSVDSPADALPQPGPPPSPPATYAPNVLFRVYPQELQGGEAPVRYRFLNAMPRTLLVVDGPGLEPTIVQPGDDVAVNGQPEVAAYRAVIGGVTYPISLAQRGKPKNRLVVFYLKAGVPAHLAVVEGWGR